MKKLFALLLTVLMVVGLFAGCVQDGPGAGSLSTVGGSNDPNATPGTPGNYNYGDRFKGITVRIAVRTMDDFGDKYFIQKLEETIGCNVELLCYGDNYDSKINTDVAVGKTPDLFQPTTLGMDKVNLYGDQGAFVNLLAPENLAQMPNFKATVVDDEALYPAYALANSDKGANYFLPTVDLDRAVNHCWMYRQDIFEKNNIEMWTDLDSFIAVLRQLKKIYPNSYPVTGAQWDNFLDRWAFSFDCNNAHTAYDWETGKWYMGIDSEGYYKMLETLQIMYNEGLMDPDIFTNATGDIDTNIITDKAFIYHSWIDRTLQQNPQLDEGEFVTAAPAVGTNNKQQQIATLKTGEGMVIANNANREATMAIVNWLYDNTPGGGGWAVSVGEEGVTYNTNADGKKVYVGLENVEVPTIADLSEKFGMWNGIFTLHVSKESPYYDFTEVQQAAQEMGEKCGYYSNIPPIPATSPEIVDLRVIYMTENQAFTQSFIVNKLTRADYDAFVKEQHSKYDVIIEAYNNAG